MSTSFAPLLLFFRQLHTPGMVQAGPASDCVCLRVCSLFREVPSASPGLSWAVPAAPSPPLPPCRSLPAAPSPPRAPAACVSVPHESFACYRCKGPLLSEGASERFYPQESARPLGCFYPCVCPVSPCWRPSSDTRRALDGGWACVPGAPRGRSRRPEPRCLRTSS